MAKLDDHRLDIVSHKPEPVAAGLGQRLSHHTYRKPEIGNLADIEHVPIGRIRAFYRAR